MIAKTVKFAVGFLGLILVIWLSLDVQRLGQHKAATEPVKFDAADYARKFWNDVTESGIAGIPDLTLVIKTLHEDPKRGFESFGKKLGISKINYFMVRGSGKIEKVAEDYVELSVDPNLRIKIATDFIYGNAVRDGSGRVNIDDFLNMTDFNAVSVAINKLVRERVVARLRNSAVPGRWMEFAGAFEISEEQPDIAEVLIIPIAAKISDGKSQ